MKKVLSLILTLNALVSFGQSKKEQIITLNNRVDSFKLALSEVTQTKKRNSELKFNYSALVESLRLLSNL